MATLILIPIAACSDDDSPVATGGGNSDQGPCSGVESTGSNSGGHIHTVCIPESDLQNPPSEIPRLLAPLRQGRADCACGWRTKRLEGDSRFRLFQARIANAVRKRLTGDRVHDSGCGFRAFRRECLERVKFFRGMHRFLPTLVRLEGYRVVEVSVAHRPRLHGRSKYGILNRAFTGLRDTFAVRWMRSRVVRWRIAEEG